MANSEKFPEICAVLKTLTDEKAALASQSAPLREQREAIRDQIRPLDAQERELNAQIKAIELPRMAELDNQISALHRGMGARKMSDGV
jgi:chromosome segregation ATPase